MAGDIALRLYDTYGFPYDLTEDALRAQNLAVDRAGFDAAMAEQKRKARAAWSGSGEKASHFKRHDLVVERASLGGGDRALRAFQRELIELCLDRKSTRLNSSH